MRKKFLLLSFPLLLAMPPITTLAATTSKEITEAASAVSPEPAIGSIQEALKEFNSLSRREKKSRFKEMKKAIKEFKEQKKAGSDVSTNTLLLVLLALFIPPLAVYLHEGETNNRFWISVLLTILGLVLFNFGGILFLGTLPAIIYALIVILGS
ncbi:YqaE/Pmp3 family membrane protein [Segetibacter aerophilus]|nr:YqaE/Pmp3 family membrane protein [Segetibacter aerophilus]